MKPFSKLLILAALCIASVKCEMGACDWFFDASFQQGFIQGFQSNRVGQDTDCFKQAYRLTFTMKELVRSFYPSHFTSTEWMIPIQRSFEVLTQLTNEFTTCQSTNFAKQLQTRLTSWPGFIDLCVTFVMAFIKEAVDTGKSKLYNSMHKFFKAKTCGLTARAAGETLGYAINMNIPSNFYKQ